MTQTSQDHITGRDLASEGPGGLSKVKLGLKVGLSQTHGPGGWVGSAAPHTSLPRPQRGSALSLSSEAHPAPFTAWVIGHEKHKCSVQTLGSGKFSNLSGKVSLSPFTSPPPPTGKDFSFGTLPMQMCEDAGSAISRLSVFY